MISIIVGSSSGQQVLIFGPPSIGADELAAEDALLVLTRGAVSVKANKLWTTAKHRQPNVSPTSVMP
jgi:hypothetical protein